jgi:hypothetical protein
MREAAAAAWEVHLSTAAAKPAAPKQTHSRRASVGVAAAGLLGNVGMSAFGTGGVDESFEMSRVWAEKREIFYEGERWRPEDNFTCVVRIPHLQLVCCRINAPYTPQAWICELTYLSTGNKIPWRSTLWIRL